MLSTSYVFWLKMPKSDYVSLLILSISSISLEILDDESYFRTFDLKTNGISPSIKIALSNIILLF